MPVATTCVDINALPYRYTEPHQVAGDRYDRRFHFQLDLGSGPENFDLTDCVLWLTCRERDGDETEVVTREVGVDGLRTEGKFRLSLTQTDTEGLEGVYLAEVEVTVPVGHAMFPEGGRKTLIRATLEYVPEIAVAEESE